MHYDFQSIQSGNEGNDWIVFTSDKQPLSSNWKDNPYFQQQLRIMPHIGLSDSVGKKIYLGDILEEPNDFGIISGSDRLPHLKIVVWDRRTACFRLGYADPDVKNGGEWPSGYTLCHENCDKSFTVAGNIYQHKHLLEC